MADGSLRLERGSSSGVARPQRAHGRDALRARRSSRCGWWNEETLSRAILALRHTAKAKRLKSGAIRAHSGAEVQDTIHEVVRRCPEIDARA